MVFWTLGRYWMLMCMFLSRYHIQSPQEYARTVSRTQQSLVNNLQLFKKWCSRYHYHLREWVFSPCLSLTLFCTLQADFTSRSFLRNQPGLLLLNIRVWPLILPLSWSAFSPVHHRIRRVSVFLRQLWFVTRFHRGEKEALLQEHDLMDGAYEKIYSEISLSSDVYERKSRIQNQKRCLCPEVCRHVYLWTPLSWGRGVPHLLQSTTLYNHLVSVLFVCSFHSGLRRS